MLVDQLVGSVGFNVDLELCSGFCESPLEGGREAIDIANIDLYINGESFIFPRYPQRGA